jgi:hypothetical protein
MDVGEDGVGARQVMLEVGDDFVGFRDVTQIKNRSVCASGWRRQLFARRAASVCQILNSPYG